MSELTLRTYASMTASVSGVGELDVEAMRSEAAIEAMAAVIQASGSVPLTHVQASAAAEWIINHNLGRRPVITTYTSGWVEVEGAELHVSDNQARVYFNQPQAGFATCT